MYVTGLTFVTYAAIKGLTAKGMTEEQAEEVTKVIKSAQDAHLEQLATKGDLSEIKNEITRIFGHLKLHDVILTLILAGVASLVAKAFFGA